MFESKQEWDRFIFELAEALVSKGYAFQSNFFKIDLDDLSNRVHAVLIQPQPETDLMDLLVDSY